MPNKPPIYVQCYRQSTVTQDSSADFHARSATSLSNSARVTAQVTGLVLEIKTESRTHRSLYLFGSTGGGVLLQGPGVHRGSAMLWAVAPAPTEATYDNKETIFT